mgnify:FL=1
MCILLWIKTKIRFQLKEEKIILGIDPGTSIMGFGIIKKKGNKMEMIMMDVLIMNKIKDHYLKLQKIFAKTLAIIDAYHPDEVALEAPFFGKNVQSMLKLGRAQGVAMAAALQRDIPITEYAPRKIKMAITGKGTASKEQVAGMLQHMLDIKEAPKYLDESDALAVAVCHALQKNPAAGGQKHSSWSAFIKGNPGRVK